MKEVKIDVFEAIEEIKKICTGKEYTSKEEEIIVLHAKHLLGEINIYNKKLSPLLKLSLTELSELLYKGYELKKKPEEKISEIYKIKPLDDFDKGFNEGIEFVLDELKIKIEGINA